MPEFFLLKLNRYTVKSAPDTSVGIDSLRSSKSEIPNQFNCYI